MGHAHVEHYPSCGCDACAERPADLVSEMVETVEAYVRGGLIETISPGAYEHELGNMSGWSLLMPGEWQGYGPLGTTHWAAWPTRSRSGV